MIDKTTALGEPRQAWEMGVPAYVTCAYLIKGQFLFVGDRLDREYLDAVIVARVVAGIIHQFDVRNKLERYPHGPWPRVCLGIVVYQRDRFCEA
jgi:hypothetical protein